MLHLDLLQLIVTVLYEHCSLFFADVRSLQRVLSSQQLVCYFEAMHMLERQHH